MHTYTKERRDELLAQARTIVEKAQAEKRDFTAAEQDSVNDNLTEVKSINEKLVAEAKSKKIFDALDDMARGAHDGTKDGLRLAFSKTTAATMSDKILGEGSIYGSKALAPSGATVVGQEFTPDPVALGQPATNLLSVLPVVTHTTDQFSYLRQSVRTNNAAVVAAGAVKPTSVYSVVRVEDQLDVIAHLSEGVPRYWFVDNAALQQFLTNELTYGLALAVEAMAIADIASTSGTQTNAHATSVLVTLRKSITKLEANGYSPAAFVLHPNDFEGIELALSSTNAVEHLSLPFDAASRRLYGVPISISNAQTEGVAHTLASGAVAINTDQTGVSVAWSETSNSDDWSKNLIRARCEGRYATSVFSPLGVVQSDLTA